MPHYTKDLKRDHDFDNHPTTHMSKSIFGRSGFTRPDQVHLLGMQHLASRGAAALPVPTVFGTRKAYIITNTW